MLAGKAKGKNIAMICDVQADLPAYFVGDITRLRQILVNLLSNAVKFTDAGEIATSVSGELLPQTAVTYCISKSRTAGLGIPRDVQERLFQPFSQGDASTNRRFGGTGLGLAISKRLCELMGGRIWVESSGTSGRRIDVSFHRSGIGSLRALLPGIATAGNGSYAGC